RLAPAASSADCPAPGLSVTVKVPLYKASDGRKITVGGDVCILPRVSFSASISGLRLSSKFTGTVTASASLAFTAELSHDITGGVNLFYVKLNPIAFDVAGVPIVIFPTLSVKLLAQGSVSAGLTAGAGESVTLGAQVMTSGSHVTSTPIYSHSTMWTPPTIF